ncbi:hypothetical protein [Geodermatophilus sp. CPCC 205761]|uniref:hypothetical protein n=1 Tax=Geodermatophilus sp. CPCC 205761 TaxID=2936597 RepID=UPI003EEB040C
MTAPETPWQCDGRVQELKAAFAAVETIVPPDVAYDSLIEALSSANAATAEWADNDCASPQQAEAAEVCNANFFTVVFAAETVGLTLQTAP